MIKNVTCVIILVFNFCLIIQAQNDSFVTLSRKKASNLDEVNTMKVHQIEYAYFGDKGRLGLMGQNGEELIPNEYVSIKQVGHGVDALLGCRKGSFIDLFDLREKQFIVKGITEVLGLTNEYYKYRKGNKIGLFWTTQSYGMHSTSKKYQSDAVDYGVIAPANYDRIETLSGDRKFFLLFSEGDILDLVIVHDEEKQGNVVDRSFQKINASLVNYEIKIDSFRNRIKWIKGYSLKDGSSFYCDHTGLCQRVKFSELNTIADFPNTVFFEEDKLNKNIELVPAEYLVLNQIMGFLKLSDTVSITKTSAGFQYRYKTSKLPMWDVKNGISTDVLLLKPQYVSSQIYVLNATIEVDERRYLDIRFESRIGDSQIELSKTGNSLRISYFEDDVRSGQFKKYYSNGQLSLEGEYCILYQDLADTTVVVDPVTYEATISINTSSKHPKKCGTWKSFDENGVLVNEEKY